MLWDSIAMYIYNIYNIYQVLKGCSLNKSLLISFQGFENTPFLGSLQKGANLKSAVIISCKPLCNIMSCPHKVGPTSCK